MSEVISPLRIRRQDSVDSNYRKGGNRSTIKRNTSEDASDEAGDTTPGKSSIIPTVPEEEVTVENLRQIGYYNPIHTEITVEERYLNFELENKSSHRIDQVETR